MGGAPLLGEPVCIELANTVFAVRGRPTEGLATPEHLADWLHNSGFVMVDEVTESDVEAARVLRAAIRAIAEATTQGHRTPDAAAVTTLNGFAASPSRWRELSVRPKRGIVERSSGRSAECALGTIADNAIELFGGPRRDELRACTGPKCMLFFIGDGRREWCSSGCGNRARAARHYAKTRDGSDGATSGRPH